MKAGRNLAITLVALGLAAVAVGLVCYRLNCEPELHRAAVAGDTMAWLRADFHLTDAQSAAIDRLQAAYAPSCDEHCRRVREAAAARDALRTARNADPATLAAAERRLRDVRANCEDALSRHVRQVAAVMRPDEGRRYLALVLPKIAGFLD